SLPSLLGDGLLRCRAIRRRRGGAEAPHYPQARYGHVAGSARRLLRPSRARGRGTGPVARGDAHQSRLFAGAPASGPALQGPGRFRAHCRRPAQGGAAAVIVTRRLAAILTPATPLRSVNDVASELARREQDIDSLNQRETRTDVFKGWQDRD